MWAIFYLIIDHSPLFVSRLREECEWAGAGAESAGGDHEGGGEKRQAGESAGGATAEGESRGQRSGEHDPLQRLSVPLDLNFSRWTKSCCSDLQKNYVRLREPYLKISFWILNKCVFNQTQLNTALCALEKGINQKPNTCLFINWKWWMLDLTATEVRGLTANVLHTGAMIFLYLKQFFCSCLINLSVLLKLLMNVCSVLQ